MPNLSRIAIVSTPRSGNTWLRLLLTNVMSGESHAIHRPTDMDWATMPEKFVLQIHWHPKQEFLDLLREHGFKVVVLGRHPADVLLSIWQFCQKEKDTASWLCGEGGDEESLKGREYQSKEFSDYCVSDRAAALLSVSRAWWQRDDAINVNYENLVATPELELARIFESTHIDYCKDRIASALQEYTMERLRPHSNNNHFWKGQPGYSMQILSPKLLNAIYAKHKQSFDVLGYASATNVEFKSDSQPNEFASTVLFRKFWGSLFGKRAS